MEAKGHYYFKELLSCNFGWPRSQYHSFWWYDHELDLSGFYGKAEDFTAGPIETFRGKRCQQLNYLVPEAQGLAFRWYVGVDDCLLYGIQTLRNGSKKTEHWFDDYKQVTSTGQFPMHLGWAFYEKNDKGEVYLRGECRVTVQEFRLDEPLDDELFKIEFQPGINIQDLRSGQLREYTLVEPEKSSGGCQTAAEVCKTVFANPDAKVFSLKTRNGSEDKFSGRPMKGASMRVHEIDLSYTPLLNVEEIEKPKVRYGKLQFQDAGQTFYHCALIGDQGDRFEQIFCVDVNRNGRWDDDERLKGFEPTRKTGMLKTWFGYIDLPLVNSNGSQYDHHMYAVYNHYDQLFVISHCWKEGVIEIGGEKKSVYLVDFNCDGRYDSGRPIPEQQLFMEPPDASYDYVSWDQNANKELDKEEIFYIGSLGIYNNQVYQISARPDGSQVALLPVDVPTGFLELPVENCFVHLRGSRGPLALRGGTTPIKIPADTYWVDYTIYYPSEEESSRSTKDGRYYHEPWVIEEGKTTKISKDLLDKTDEDEAVYKKKVEAYERTQELARIQEINDEYNTLCGERVIDFSDFDMDGMFQLKEGTRLLICFWDFNQRSSRHEVSELAKLGDMLTKKGVEVALEPIRITPEWPI